MTIAHFILADSRAVILQTNALHSLADMLKSNDSSTQRGAASALAEFAQYGALSCSAVSALSHLIVL